MSEPIWCIMPILAGPEMTEAAIGDLLAQSVPTRLLLVNQGVDDDFRDRLERLAEQESERIFLWNHMPPLPSLSASWNRALDFVWRTSSGEPADWVALVVNNDVRLFNRTVEILAEARHLTDALFVSAVGVDEAGWKADRDLLNDDLQPILSGVGRGGPDFSCYLISYECHQRFRFDEAFIPAFCEDLDTHRRVMLAGAGGRMFSINLPYWHLASQTLKAVDPAQAAAIRHTIETVSRAHYAAKWGGPVNAETFRAPFGKGEYAPWLAAALLSEGTNLMTTPELFDYYRDRWNEPSLEELNRRMLALEARKDAADGLPPALREPFLRAEADLEAEYQEDRHGQDG